MKVLIREAKKKDVPAMLQLIKELALYEKASQEVTNTVEQMEEDGFNKSPIFSAYVAEVDSEVIGLAIYYTAYSTWKGKYIYLDDLIVSEQFRKYGIGKKLFDAVSNSAKSSGAKQLRWHVLDWNEPAINFYKKYNASFESEWITCKLTRQQIEELSGA